MLFIREIIDSYERFLMNAPLTFLGVDIGAESGRLMAGSWDGHTITLEEQHRFSNGAVPIGQTLRWDLLHLWQQIQDSLSAAARSYGSSVRSIGVDTWALDYVLLSKSGEWLGLPYSYRDLRTSGVVEELIERLGRERIFSESGTQFMEINTLCQLVAAQKQTPELLEQARKFLMIPDWIHWALCGAEVCEFTNATTTQFVNPLTRQWSTALLDDLGIPTHFLPEIIQPGTHLGSLRSSLSKTSGLSGIPVIAPATHDTGSAVVGVPTLKTGSASWAYISSGTWSLVGVELPNAALGEAVQRYNFTNEGGVDGTYRLLKNVMGMWLIQQLRLAFVAAGHSYDYAHLVQLAAHAEPFRSLINPDHVRFLRPTNMVEEVQDFCRESGQLVPETPGQLVRCVLEGLALAYRRVLSQIEEITGEAIEVIHIVGGGGRNALLNQFTADASQKVVIAGPVEATVLGNVLFQAKASGEISTLQELRTVVRDSFEHEMREFPPDSKQVAQWNDAFVRWLDLLKPNSR